MSFVDFFALYITLGTPEKMLSQEESVTFADFDDTVLIAYPDYTLNLIEIHCISNFGKQISDI